MDPHLLDAFAARSVGTTLSEFTHAQRMPARNIARRPRSPHRRRLATTVTGAALVTLPSVAVIAQVLR